MSTHANMVRMTVTSVASAGTGTITLNAASSGYRSFASAYGADATVDVLITEGTTWEVARNCAYTNSGTTLGRGTLESSSTGSAVAFTSDAVVSVVATAAFGNSIENFLGAWGALSGENSITTTATAVIGRLNVCSGTSADYTVTLPAVSGNAGRYIGFRMDAGLTRLVTLDGSGSETIDGQATRVMWSQETALLYCDGVTWTKMAGKSRPMIGVIKRVTTQSIATGSSIKVQCATLHSDNVGSIVDTSGQRLVCKRTGSYVVTGKVSIDATTTIIQVHVYVAAALVIYSKLQFSTVELPGAYAQSIYDLTAGQAVELYGRHDHGSNRDVYGSTGYLDTFLSIQEVPSW